MPQYIYSGPRYRNGVLYDSRWEEHTTAKTALEAKRNFQFKAGKGYEIIPEYIKEIGNTWEEEHPDRICPDCGNLLHDNGDCPLCSNSDYSIYDEIKLMKDIDDGNYPDY